MSESTNFSGFFDDTMDLQGLFDIFSPENNLVLAAHNYATHFGWLYTAAIGDEVTFTDMDGNVFRYRVAEIEQLRPSERERMIESEWPLTCYTCSIGNRTRLAIRCEKTEG